MGIRGVWTTFRKSFNIIDPLEMAPSKIGIDMFSLVYTHRAHLEELLALLKSWSDHGHTMTCIWDGTAPKEKKEIIGQRRSARESAMDKKGDLETYLTNFGDQLSDTDVKHLKTAITSLSWQGWHLTGTLKREIQEKLGSSVQHIYAPGEADDMLIEMSATKIDIILSLDSDIFAMGAERIWRLLRIRGKWIIEDISVENVCNTWGINLSQLQDACFLAGWDRCHLTGTSYMPFENAVNRVKFYQTWSAVIEKFHSEDTVDKDAIDRLNVIKKESKGRWINILRAREI
jgi:5'-3' exonuclease